MTFFKYVKDLMRSNSGSSSKGFAFVMVTLMSLSLLGICGISLIIDVIINGHIVTDLMGMAAFVGSISTLLGAAGFTKVYGEKVDNDSYYNYERPYQKREKYYSDDSSNIGSCPKISEEEANKVI